MAYFSDIVNEIPVGTIMFLAHDQTPSSGFALCNGAIIDTSSSPAFTRLFDKIGALYVETWADGESIIEGELRKSISDGTVYIATSSGTTDGTDISDDSGVTWTAASTKFQLPDLRGEFLRGYDDGRGVDANRTLGVDGWQQATATCNQVDYGHVLITPLNYDGTQGTKAVTHAVSDDDGYSFTGNYYSTRPRNIATIYYIKY